MRATVIDLANIIKIRENNDDDDDDVIYDNFHNTLIVEKISLPL